MIEIEEDLITPNEFSRPATKLKEVLGVVMHWTANPRASAKANRDFFETKKTGMSGYGSAHYVVGLKGEIIRCVPEDEVAYHCGSSQIDSASGKVYTDLARRFFGKYASVGNSPNACTIGIEMCPLDWEGNFAEETLESAAELCADILIRHSLPASRVFTHKQIVGWKDCPLLWAKKPQAREAFFADVERLMKSR